jgi:hypothetical protein
MGTGAVLPEATGTNPPRLVKRHSLADVLGTRDSRTVLHDPRTEAVKLRQEEGQRYQSVQEQKLAAFRGQMPTTLSSPNLNMPGGYLSGQFNDGTGGGLGQPRTSTAMSGYAAGPAMAANNGAMNRGMLGTTYAQMNGGPVPGYGMPSNGYGAPVVNAHGMPMAMHMQMPMTVQSPAQMDRVERWRQSVMP